MRPKTKILIAPPILPPCAPPLVPQITVKYRLPQLLVDVVVRVAQPVAKLVACANAHRVPLDVFPKVVGAHPARVQLGEEAHEACQVRLFRLRRPLRVLRCDSVQQRPGSAAQRLYVGRAVARRPGLCCGRFE